MNAARHRLPLFLLLTACVLDTGCVRRTITVRSDPPGALVHLNDKEVGRTPLTVAFVFYGTYDVRLEKEGYQTLQTDGVAAGPWWQWPGVDLLAELGPDRHVKINWHYKLTKADPSSLDGLLDRAETLRKKAPQSP
ncbi:MAG: PEGA domain-containing protein [Phycisphaeraceae bacterium]|nr:PEGA domain-containing protein [Phycisphaeraceae bacterium]